MSDEPPKFITENGVRKMNPAWKSWKAGASGASSSSEPQSVAPTMKNEATALPVVSNMHQLSQLGADAQLAPGYQAVTEKYTSAAVAQQVGLSQDQMLEQIGKCFAKYEIPAGLLSKLFVLQKFSCIDCVVDNSGSMGCLSDMKFPGGQLMTRWQEVLHRLTQMFEVLAYVPFPPFHIRFLNGSAHVVLQKNPGETPAAFTQRAATTLTSAFSSGPTGTTPAKERISEMLQRSKAAPTICYFFGDGVPNGGEDAQEDITKMIKTRPNPELSPFTFFSCTNVDADCEWMRNCEEQSLYCAEYDDYNDEAQEILEDQGLAFSYSYGTHLVAQLVGASFPEDLDAMDESAPFTMSVMSELLGYRITDAEYDYYFGEFMKAQQKKRPESKEDKIKAEYVQKWPALKEEFRRAAFGKDIPTVQEFRKKLMEAKDSGCVIA